MIARGAAAYLGALAAALVASACFAQGMVLFIEVARSNPNPVRPSEPINDLRGLSLALRHCWSPPPFDSAHGPVDVTFSVSFKRSGDLFGKPPVVTFVRPVTPEQRERYDAAVAAALDLCSHLPFTDAMGGAVAGRVFRVNILDRRDSRKV